MKIVDPALGDTSVGVWVAPRSQGVDVIAELRKLPIRGRDWEIETRFPFPSGAFIFHCRSEMGARYLVNGIINHSEKLDYRLFPHSTEPDVLDI